MPVSGPKVSDPMTVTHSEYRELGEHMRPDRIDREEEVLVDIISCVKDAGLLDVHLTARTVDLSATGMKVVMKVDVPKETHLGLRLDFGSELYRLEGDVRWALSGDEISIGVEIDPESADFSKWTELFNQVSAANDIEMYQLA